MVATGLSDNFSVSAAAITKRYAYTHKRRKAADAGADLTSQKLHVEAHKLATVVLFVLLDSFVQVHAPHIDIATKELRSTAEVLERLGPS